MVQNLFPGAGKSSVRAAVFMSGSGTNAEALFRFCAERPDAHFKPALIVTDAPRTSRARALAAEWKLPLVELDIRLFYAERGESSIALSSARRREIRMEWTCSLGSLVAPHAVDFGVLAGFVPLCNITAELPCLNVHPGNLTCEVEGRRILAGLHFRPVETAILAGHAALRSSVILAQPFEGCGQAEMDSGPVLGVSPEMEIDLCGTTVAGLEAVSSARGRAPFHDRLREVAAENLEKLKYAGDHVVLPRAADDFAAGRFGMENGTLFFRTEAAWKPIRTVEYGVEYRKLMEL